MQSEDLGTRQFLGIETVSSNFQENMLNIGKKNRNRPACLKVVKSASKLLALEARSQQLWHRSSSAEIVSHESVCIPFICLDSQGRVKSREGESTSSNNTPTWHTQSWYTELLGISVRNQTILPLREDLLKGPHNQQHPLIQN